MVSNENNNVIPDREPPHPEKTTEGVLKAARLGDLNMLTELHQVLVPTLMNTIVQIHVGPEKYSLSGRLFVTHHRRDWQDGAALRRKIRAQRDPPVSDIEGAGAGARHDRRREGPDGAAQGGRLQAQDHLLHARRRRGLAADQGRLVQQIYARKCDCFFLHFGGLTSCCLRLLCYVFRIRLQI